jgi:WD40-like Beta Propeller Repeat
VKLRGQRWAKAVVLASILLCIPATAQASFSGGNGKIAYDGGGLSTIWPDGSGATAIGVTMAYDPAWSSDGSRIAFTRCRGVEACRTEPSPGRASNYDGFEYFPATDVWVMNVDGSGLKKVADEAADPAWSPDGTKVAFFDRYDDLGWVNVDGPGRGRLTFDHPSEACFSAPVDPSQQCWINDSPAWSPNGQRIAFTRKQVETTEDIENGGFMWGEGESDIWLVNADGTGRVDITNTPYPPVVFEHDPNWLPNGTKMAFSRYTGNPYDQRIFTMNADGSAPAQLTSGFTDNDPAWSPDGGAKIAFSRADSTGHLDLFLMNANGSEQTNITNNAYYTEATAQTLDWQPLRRYPRPGGASPLRVPLVPAFGQCTLPNSSHVAPLDRPSCTPPLQESPLLTTSTIGRGGGHVKLTVLPGNSSTLADEADVVIKASTTDVVCAVTAPGCSTPGADYSGQLVLRLDIRLTDQASTVGVGAAPATVQDTDLSAPVDCSANGQPIGASCSLATTADTLLPGFAKEGKRSVISTMSVSLRDAGTDGSVGSCPPTCGTGDESVFERQGLFTP